MTKNKAEMILATLESFTLAVQHLQSDGIDPMETRAARDRYREKVISLLMTAEEK